MKHAYHSKGNSGSGKGGQGGSGVLKHCGPGMESCRPAPKNLIGKHSGVPSEAPAKQGHRRGKD